MWLCDSFMLNPGYNFSAALNWPEMGSILFCEAIQSKDDWNYISQTPQQQLTWPVPHHKYLKGIWWKKLWYPANIYIFFHEYLQLANMKIYVCV